MAHSSPARWLAPLALAAAMLALVVVLTTSGSSDTPPGPEQVTSGPAGATATTPARSATTATTPAQPAPSATYTVQAGDFLSTVAEKTGVSVDRLRQLNPGLDANAMHVGQKIRLK
jgi:LysM repeat protein